MTPDRRREIALDIVLNVANGALKDLTDTDVAEIIGEFDDVAFLTDEQIAEASKEIVKLAHGVKLIATFPGLDAGTGDGDADPADDEEKFEVGKFYIAQNGAFVFQCNQVVADGIALGPELRVDGRPSSDRHYVYIVPGVRELWEEIDEKDVHAKYGEHGWTHRPKTRPAAATTPQATGE